MDKVIEKVGAKWFWTRVDLALEGERLSDFCRRVGISENTVYGQRLNDVMPKEKQIALFASALGVSQSWLLTGINPVELSKEVREVIDLISSDPSKLRMVRVVLGFD